MNAHVNGEEDDEEEIEAVARSTDASDKDDDAVPEENADDADDRSDTADTSPPFIVAPKEPKLHAPTEFNLKMLAKYLCWCYAQEKEMSVPLRSKVVKRIKRD
ncbi:hypothetical protein PVK06_027018 [Gossypium arboreum]|uniref:Uncharacterized protein n=1 Tax=Gossypium arboreum TaxID=29729 RepID=A0ABR0NZ80_GOSAR|nr:hypothetical protein PVK06_027018 [Gossypium arboreum]